MKLRALVTLSTLMVVSLMAAPAQAGENCLGKPATIVGSGGPDAISGTNGNDVIVAKGGNDVISGRGGNDRICGGGGRDEMVGGSGGDRMDGGPGPDEFVGGSGSDTAIYKSRTGGVEVMIDDQANDGRIAPPEMDFVRPSVEKVIGGDGEDRFVGGFTLSINQVFRAGPGDDEAFGGDGDDNLFGEGGGDSLNGQDGDDLAVGGPGNDECFAETVSESCEVVGP